MANNNPISNKLNMEPIETSSAIRSLITESTNDSAMKDFETSRGNLLQQMININESIRTLSEIAEQSQHPRAFEVLGKLIDSSANISKQLLEIQSKIREIDASSDPTSKQGDVINNNLILTTTDLLKMLKTEDTKSKTINGTHN